MKKIAWLEWILAVLIICGGFYLALPDSNPDIVVSPEKQEIVKEGFSGQKGSESVVVTHKEFTGAQKGIVINPEKQEIVKEGFSGQKGLIESHKEFNGANHGIVITPEPATEFSGYSKAPELKPTLIPAPEPAKVPQATPMAIPDVIQKTPKVDKGIVIEKTIEKLESILVELKSAR